MNEPTIKAQQSRKTFLPLLLAVAGVLAGGSVSQATTYYSADFSSSKFTNGYLGGFTNGVTISLGQDGWLQSGTSNTNNPVTITNGTAKLTPTSTGAQTVFHTNPITLTAPSTIYASFDVNISNAHATGASFFTFVGSATGGTNYGRLYLRRPGGVAATSGFNVGIKTGAATQVFGTTAFPFGAYKIVVAYDANTGTSNDAVAVYVNPIGQNRSAWTNEISVTTAEADPAGFASITLTGGATSGSTANTVSISKLITADSVSEALPPPSVPISSAATAPGTGGFTANWTASSGATKYYLDVATDSGFTSIVGVFNNFDVGNVTSYSVTGSFTGGTTLYYRVRAYNSAGSSANSATQIVGITAALLPTVSNGAVDGTVTWTNGPGWTPNNPISTNTATVTFNGLLTGNLVANNDSTGNFVLNAITNAISGTGSLTYTGGTLQFVANGSTKPTLTFANTNLVQTFSNNIQVDAELKVSQAGSTASNSILAGPISGVGGMNKSGNGYVWITRSNNTFGGIPTVGAGQLTVVNLGNAGSPSSLGTNGTISLGGGTNTGTLRWESAASESSDKEFNLVGSTGGGTLEVRGTNNLLTLSGSVNTGTNTNSRTFAIGGDGSATFNGVISGNAALRVNGSKDRTVILGNASNSFGGQVTIDGNITGKSYKVQVASIGMSGSNSPLGTNGTIHIGSTVSNSFNFLVFSSTVNSTTDKTINLAGSNAGHALIANKAAALLKFTSLFTATGPGAKTLYVDQDDVGGITELAGSIPNSADGSAIALNKNGLGTLVLSASNTFTGGVTIKGGTLKLANSQALAGGDVIIPTSGVGSCKLSVNYSGQGSQLGVLTLQPNAAATIDLGTNSASSLSFASATLSASALLTIANSTKGSLYITDTNSVPLSQIKSVENPTYLPDFTTNGKLIFVENAVTITDATGTIDGLQAQINSTRAANADALIKIQLKSGTTYSVTANPLILDSNMCLTGGSSSSIESANSSVTATSLVKINGSTIAINNLTLNGKNAPLYGIESAVGVSRINVDQVTVSGTGKDGIYLQGAGSAVFNNEMTVTRCRASNIPNGAGIHIKGSTQVFCSDNLSQSNQTGFMIETSQHGTFYRNQAISNTKGLSLQGANWCKIADNVIQGGSTGIFTDSTSLNNFLVGNILRNCPQGLSLDGIGNTSYANSFGSGVGTNVVSTGGNFLFSAQQLGVSDSGYFHPPTSTNLHNDPIVNGKARTDITTNAPSLSAIQTAYNAARTSKPYDVIVLHLTAPEITGDSPLSLSSNTCVLLDGTIKLNPGISAFSATNSTCVSISGGTINGQNTTGRYGINLDQCSRILIEGVTLRDFGDKNTRVSGSDVIKVGSCSNPVVISSCTIDGGASRGIWTISSSSVMAVGNTISNVNMDGIDFDSATLSSLLLRNTSQNNVRYGIFIEEGAQNNIAIGNTCSTNEIGINLYSSYTSSVQRQTWHNGLFMNSVDSNLRGIRFGAATPSSTSENFAFNNRIYGNSNNGIDAQNTGVDNYLSQNIFSGNAADFGDQTSAVSFNPPRVANSTPVVTEQLNVLENSINTNPNVPLASDSDGNLLTYSILSGSDAGKFQLDPVSGLLAFISAPDYETPTDVGGVRAGDNIYNLTVQVSDGTEVVTKNIAVTVQDVVENHAPIGIALTPSTISENNALSAQAGVFSTTDTDVGNTFTYTLVTGTGGDDNASFSIIGANLVAATVFNYETKNSYSLRVRTTDQGGLFFEQSFVISVSNLIDSPAEYKAAWLSTNQLSTNSIWTDDPNKVGYSLATAYAFGLSPSVSGGKPVTITTSSNNSVKILYLQNTNTNNGVSYAVKGGVNLATGLLESIPATMSTNQPTNRPTGYAQYEATYSGGTNTRGFLKVQAVVP